LATVLAYREPKHENGDADQRSPRHSGHSKTNKRGDYGYQYSCRHWLNPNFADSRPWARQSLTVT
jgi:hypothetical protein